MLGKCYVEVYVKASLKVVEKRDPKGLYKKARLGEIQNFTGLDSPYEEPLAPEIILDTEKDSAPACAKQIYDYLSRNGFIADDS